MIPYGGARFHGCLSYQKNCEHYEALCFQNRGKPSMHGILLLCPATEDDSVASYHKPCFYLGNKPSSEKHDGQTEQEMEQPRSH